MLRARAAPQAARRVFSPLSPRFSHLNNVTIKRTKHVYVCLCGLPNSAREGDAAKAAADLARNGHVETVSPNGNPKEEQLNGDLNGLRVSRVILPRHPHLRHSLGVAFVEFEEDEFARLAVKKAVSAAEQEGHTEQQQQQQHQQQQQQQQQQPIKSFWRPDVSSDPGANVKEGLITVDWIGQVERGETAPFVSFGGETGDLPASSPDWMSRLSVLPADPTARQSRPVSVSLVDDSSESLALAFPLPRAVKNILDSQFVSLRADPYRLRYHALPSEVEADLTGGFVPDDVTGAKQARQATAEQLLAREPEPLGADDVGEELMTIARLLARRARKKSGLAGRRGRSLSALLGGHQSGTDVDDADADGESLPAGVDLFAAADRDAASRDSVRGDAVESGLLAAGDEEHGPESSNEAVSASSGIDRRAVSNVDAEEAALDAGDEAEPTLPSGRPKAKYSSTTPLSKIAKKRRGTAVDENELLDRLDVSNPISVARLFERLNNRRAPIPNVYRDSQRGGEPKRKATLDDVPQLEDPFTGRSSGPMAGIEYVPPETDGIEDLVLSEDDGGFRARRRQRAEAKKPYLSESLPFLREKQVSADGWASGWGSRKSSRAVAILHPVEDRTDALRRKIEQREGPPLSLLGEVRRIGYDNYGGDTFGSLVVNRRNMSDYFRDAGSWRNREEVLLPFIATGTLGKFDAYLQVSGGGHSGQAGAAKLAIARALQNMDPSLRPALKLAGCLTRDSRMVERKKPGQAKARKKFQWVRR